MMQLTPPKQKGITGFRKKVAVLLIYNLLPVSPVHLCSYSFQSSPWCLNSSVFLRLQLRRFYSPRNFLLTLSRHVTLARKLIGALISAHDPASSSPFLTTAYAQLKCAYLQNINALLRSKFQ